VLYTRKVDKCSNLTLSNLRVSYLGAHRDYREGTLVRIFGKKVWMEDLNYYKFSKKKAE
jgi:hypothetical protein